MSYDPHILKPNARSYVNGDASQAPANELMSKLFKTHTLKDNLIIVQKVKMNNKTSLSN